VKPPEYTVHTHRCSSPDCPDCTMVTKIEQLYGLKFVRYIEYETYPRHAVDFEFTPESVPTLLAAGYQGDWVRIPTGGIQEFMRKMDEAKRSLPNA